MKIILEYGHEPIDGHDDAIAFEQIEFDGFTQDLELVNEILSRDTAPDRILLEPEDGDIGRVKECMNAIGFAHYLSGNGDEEYNGFGRDWKKVAEGVKREIERRNFEAHVRPNRRNRRKHK